MRHLPAIVRPDPALMRHFDAIRFGGADDGEAGFALDSGRRL